MRGAKKTARDWIELGKQLKVDELGWASVGHDVAVAFFVHRRISSIFGREKNGYCKIGYLFRRKLVKF